MTIPREARAMSPSPTDWIDAMGRPFAELDRHAEKRVALPESLSLQWQKADRAVVLAFDHYEYEASVELRVAAGDGVREARLHELEDVRNAAGGLRGMHAGTPERLEGALRYVWASSRASLLRFLDGDTAEFERAISTRSVRHRAFAAAQLLEDATAAARERRWIDAVQYFDQVRTAFPEVPFAESHARKEAIARAHAERGDG